MLNCNEKDEQENTSEHENEDPATEMIMEFIGKNSIVPGKLCDISLTGVGLKTLPASFGLLTTLFNLELADNKLTNLPIEMARLHVKRLVISGNLLTKLPMCFYVGLEKVSDLDLSRNLIKRIQNPPLCASRLWKLQCRYNKMKKLPEWILTSCPKLWILSTGHNRPMCRVGCKTISQTKLRHLDLTDCSIHNLDFLSETQTLLSCYVGNYVVGPSSGNCFWEFPEAIYQSAASLQELSLKATRLTELPPEIGMFQRLEFLDLRECGLISLPLEVGLLLNLETLLLSNNKLVKLPDSVGNLVNLMNLQLDGNEFDYLPDSIKNLQHLAILDVYNNRIQDWDYSWLQLGSLLALDLDQNLCAIEVCECYCKMRKLLRSVLNLTHRMDGHKEEYDDDSDFIEEGEWPLAELMGSMTSRDKYWTPGKYCTNHDPVKTYGIQPVRNWFMGRWLTQPAFDVNEGQFDDASED